MPNEFVNVQFTPNRLMSVQAFEDNGIIVEWNHHQVEKKPCTCCYIPPHISNKIGEANRELYKEQHHQLIDFHQNEERHFRRNRMNFLGHHHKQETVKLTDVEKKAHELVKIFDCRHQETLSKRLVREGSSDQTAERARKGLVDTFVYYHDVHGRNSIDGKGMELKGHVHYGKRYANAFWDEKVMVFGDGDGLLFGDFTLDEDVMGHELTHGVTQYTAHLEYENQSGALNEHISDVFGIHVKQKALNVTADKADWLIGDRVLLGPGALRSMKAPGTAYDEEYYPLLGNDPQPAHMGDYKKMSDDNGGVHINSGIPNFAFYKVSVALGGYSWEKAGKVWYHTLTNRSLKPTASFADFANATIASAKTLYKEEPKVAESVVTAWREVGVIS